MKIEYYFSVLSPFSYLGADRFTKIVSKYNLEVTEKPLDLVGEIFPNTGGSVSYTHLTLPTMRSV